MYRKKPAASVLIVSASQKADAYLREALAADRFSPVETVSSAGEAKRFLLDRPTDIVIINTPLPDEFGTQLAFDLAENVLTGVLLFVRAEFYEQVADKAGDCGILTVSRPSSRQTICQILQLLAATRVRLRTLEEKASSLEARMKEIRLVNRAKWLLIDRLQMSETEAHKYIEKTAMDQCVKRQEIAENIIKTYDS